MADNLRNVKTDQSFLMRLEHVRPLWTVVTSWIVVAGIGLALSLVPPVHIGDAVRQLLTALCGIVLSFAVMALARRALTSRWGWLSSGTIVLAAGTILWMVDSVIQVLPSPNPLTFATFAERRYNWVFFTLLFGLQVQTLALIASAKASAERQHQLTEARLAALRYQVNPHFLFNTLNALAALVEEGEQAAAEEMIGRLSEFLRATLSEDQTDLVPLERELDMIHAYLDVEAVRFGSRLTLEETVDPAALDMLVPSLILQPLVENAIRHAVAPTMTGARILLFAHAEKAGLTLRIEDRRETTAGVPPRAGTGTGLRNVAARLHAHFEGRASLRTERLERGFAATIRIPIVGQ